MKKKLLLMALPLVVMNTAAHAFVPVFEDINQNIQQALIQGKNIISVAQTELGKLETLKTTVMNGYAGAKNIVSNLDELPQAYLTSFENKIKNEYNDAKNLISNVEGLPQTYLNSLEGEANGLVDQTMKNVLGQDIVGNWSAQDLMGLDLDKITNMGEDALKNLTEEELKKLLGDQLSGKLSADQVKNIADDPKKVVSLLNGLSTAKRTQTGGSSKPTNGLEGLGIKGSNGVNTTSVQTTSLGPDGNRSDAFNGTGNASSAQFAEAQEVFKEMRGRIEDKMQLPKTREAMKSVTPKKLAEIRLLQQEAQKELGIQGLAMAWIRQEVTKQKLPKQEEAIVKLFNEKASDERGVIQLVSALSIMTAEAQNYASTVYAVDLTAYASQANTRTGSTTTPLLSDEEVGDTNGASSGTNNTATEGATGETPASPAGQTAQ